MNDLLYLIVILLYNSWPIPQFYSTAIIAVMFFSYYFLVFSYFMFIYLDIMADAFCICLMVMLILKECYTRTYLQNLLTLQWQLSKT